MAKFGWDFMDELNPESWTNPYIDKDFECIKATQRCRMGGGLVPNRLPIKAQREWLVQSGYVLDEIIVDFKDVSSVATGYPVPPTPLTPDQIMGVSAEKYPLGAYGGQTGLLGRAFAGNNTKYTAFGILLESKIGYAKDTSCGVQMVPECGYPGYPSHCTALFVATKERWAHCKLKCPPGSYQTGGICGPKDGYKPNPNPGPNPPGPGDPNYPPFVPSCETCLVIDGESSTECENLIKYTISRKELYPGSVCPDINKNKEIVQLNGAGTKLYASAGVEYSSSVLELPKEVTIQEGESSVSFFVYVGSLKGNIVLSIESSLSKICKKSTETKVSCEFENENGCSPTCCTYFDDTYKGWDNEYCPDFFSGTPYMNKIKYTPKY